MKNSSKNFSALVAKMDQLQENEQGMLKGGIQTLSAISAESSLLTNYFLCVTTSNTSCPVKTIIIVKPK